MYHAGQPKTPSFRGQPAPNYGSTLPANGETRAHREFCAQCGVITCCELSHADVEHCPCHAEGNDGFFSAELDTRPLGVTGTTPCPVNLTRLKGLDISARYHSDRCGGDFFDGLTTGFRLVFLLLRCTQFPELRLFVFNPFPGFKCC